MFYGQGVVLERSPEKLGRKHAGTHLQTAGNGQHNLSVKDLEKTPDHSLAFVTRDSSIKAIPYRNIDAIGRPVPSTPRPGHGEMADHLDQQWQIPG